MKPLLLIGNGGHAKVVKDIVNLSDEYTFKGYLDDNISEPYVENDVIYDNLSNIQKYQEDYYFNIAIGSNGIREKVFNKLDIPIEKYPVLKHPTSIISPSVNIGFGTVIMAKCVINAETKIGTHCIINTAAIVEHDNVISDYAHISPNSTLTGGVKVGTKSQIGASATVIPTKKVGDNTIVGAGATVVNDIGNNQIVVGSPAKPIRR
nr:acetyltransferase [Mammaliicoccus sp. Marseille-Q6498]